MKLKYNYKDLINLFIPFLLVIIPIFIPNIIVERVTTSFYIIMLLGMIDALATIIPGLSGTAILMMLGFYTFIITNIGHPSLANLNILIPFGLGFFIMTIILVKIMNYLLKEHNQKTYLGIIGFTLSSIIIILYKAFSVSINPSILAISLGLLVIGIYIGFIIEK